MLGKDANYVPGWDCHGLPIEWKIEEKYRAAGKDKDAVPIVEFRARMPRVRRALGRRAARGVQAPRRRAATGSNPYTTMAFAAEAQIVREIGKFLMNGGLYRGASRCCGRWSRRPRWPRPRSNITTMSRTRSGCASRCCARRRPALDGRGGRDLDDDALDHPRQPRHRLRRRRSTTLVIAVTAAAEGSRGARRREACWSPTDAARDVREGRRASQAPTRCWSGKGAELAGTVAAHPLRGQGYDFDVPLLRRRFRHHRAGHRLRPYRAGPRRRRLRARPARNGIEVPQTVGEDGIVSIPHVPLFAGKRVLRPDGKKGDADPAVIAALEGSGRAAGRRASSPIPIRIAGAPRRR